VPWFHGLIVAADGGWGSETKLQMVMSAPVLLITTPVGTLQLATVAAALTR
jgi:hypothetical protein